MADLAEGGSGVRLYDVSDLELSIPELFRLLFGPPGLN